MNNGGFGMNPMMNPQMQQQFGTGMPNNGQGGSGFGFMQSR